MLRGSTAETVRRENMPKARRVLVDTLDEGVEMVKRGQVDALLADHPFCMVTVYRYGGQDRRRSRPRSPSNRSASRCRPTTRC